MKWQWLYSPDDNDYYAAHNPTLRAKLLNGELAVYGGATLTKGKTFGATETVTNTKLHSLVDDGSVTGIVDADVSASANIAASKLDLSSSGYVTTGANNTFTGDNTFTGGFNLTSKSLTDVLGLIYPVGIVVTFGVATNPATLLGIGTWTAITGKVIVGKAVAGTFNTLDGTGGAETVAHTHTIPNNTQQTNVGWDGSGCGSKYYTTISHNHGGTSGSTSPSVLQPYIVKYVWQRTA